MSGSLRRDALLALANCMANNRNLFAEAEALTGKPVADSLLDVDSCVETFKFFAGFADKMHGRSFRSLSNHHSFTVREPLGVCGLITSFNYPLLLASWKIAPALASGNTVVIKPAHQTPLSTLLLASLAGKSILPPGVLNVVLGDANVGAALANHSGIQKLSFTGSTRGGAAVARILAGSAGDAGFPRPGTFELGGKNAIIVCEDADLEASVDHVVDAAFSNSGQNCCAASRLLLHASIHDKFIQMLVDRVKLWKVGNAMDPHTRVGPLVDSRAVANVVEAIEKAKSDGFHLAYGGGASVLESGFFVHPTVFTGVSDTSSLALHEIFGPVLAVLHPFETVDEAIQRANATPYGLAAGIFTNSLRHANLAVSKLKAGFVQDQYDVIVLGTGLSECILSGLLSVEGKKVLQMDRNDYYGGASASLKLSQLYAKFKSGTEPPEAYGKDRQYSVDLIPKFAMASGEFVDILYHTDVTRYLEFRQVAGSFVYRDGKISKVPSNNAEALLSPLMSLTEKNRAKGFFEFIQNYDFANPATQQGLDLNTVPMSEVYAKFGLEAGTQDFIGHALALHLDDSYMSQPAKDTYERICLYMNSMA
ncbi:Rab GDP dissociation inhibitor alpha, partial [Chytriomyces hyalinus]